MVGGLHLPMDDFVHQVLDAFVGSHEARQLSQAGAVPAVAHLVFELREVVVEAVCGVCQHDSFGRGLRLIGRLRLGGFQTPRAALAISACGVCNLRVRRL